jgi:hypothetical protein
MSKESLKERPAVKDEQGNICRVRKIWDDGGKTCDRYSITFEIYNNKSGKWDIWKDGDKIVCLGLSSDPISPQGFSQFSTCQEGRHLGKRIAWSELPKLIQKHILLRMKQ